MNNGLKVKVPLDLLGPVNALSLAHMALLGSVTQLRAAGLPANAGAVQAVAEAAASQLAAIIAESQKRMEGKPP